MTNNTKNETKIDRRSFIGGSIAAAAIVAGSNSSVNAADAPLGPPPGSKGPGSPESNAPPSGGVFGGVGAEVSLRHCYVEGEIPSDLSGGFYRTGPDPQYPIQPGNIPFDGEGHVSLFRIKNGRCDYLTRYVKNDRYKAQDEAGKLLFPMYRNPSMDDSSVKGLSRSTANTHVINHKGLILALKEDSPPAALDLDTLETVEANYTFDGQLPSDQPFTAHPKVDSVTGNMIAFSYEAEGFGSDVVRFFEIDKNTSKKVWEASIKVPYVSMIHDFAVTENHIAVFVVPLAIDHEQMKRGGIHWSWDADKKTHLGILRRDGDGKDIRWAVGPKRSGTHTMGAFEDNGKLYFDSEITAGNPFPFMPNKDGSPPDFVNSSSYPHRLSIDTRTKSLSGYGIEKLYDLQTPLPRQDDRYNTMAYRYGFAGCPDPDSTNPNPMTSDACYARLDLQTRKHTLYKAPSGTGLAECCFAPKGPNAKEGEGYLLGVATRRNENGRGDLLILDAERLEDGPIATVKLSVPPAPQVHGWWVPEEQYPTT